MPHFRHKKLKNIVFPVIFLLMLFSLGACGGGGDDSGDAVTRAGKLDCAEECVLYGQCGTNQENETVILGNSSQPDTTNPDVTLPQDTAVTILSEQQKTLLFPASELGPEREETHRFYQVQPEGSDSASWVAAWCVVENQ